jgi:hypothetical protein
MINRGGEEEHLYLFICGLFNYAVISWGDIESNDGIISE